MIHKNQKTPAMAFVAAVLLTTAISFFFGCAEAPPKAPARSKPLIGVLLYRKDDTYISLVSEALHRALAEEAEVAVQHGRDEQFVQDEQIEAMLEKKVNALIVNLVDPQAASSVVDKVKKAGIPVVFFNREPDLNVIKTYAKASFVGTNAPDAGKMQGDIIADLWKARQEYDRNKDGTLNYVMFQGNLDNPEAVARTEHSVKTAKERGVPLRQIGGTSICNWNEPLARQAMQTFLSAYEDQIELVISNNDSMALGAIAALAERGYNAGDPARFIPVVGVDAIPQALEAIRKGTMSATVKQDGEAMAKAIAALTLNAVFEKDFLDGTPYAWDASGIAVRIPYLPYRGEGRGASADLETVAETPLATPPDQSPDKK